MLNRAHCNSWPRKKKQNPRLFLVYNTDTKIDIQLFFCLNDHHITFFTSKILAFCTKMQNNFLCLVFFWMCMFACPTICFPWLVLTTCCTITECSISTWSFISYLMNREGIMFLFLIHKVSCFMYYLIKVWLYGR